MSEQQPNSQELAQAQAKGYQQSMNAELAATMRNIHSSLVLNPGAITNSIPENIFTQTFLPFFSGQIPITEEENPIPAWINIAGTPVSEVSVTDVATGKELFRVPPLYDTTVFNVARGSEDNLMKNIIENYNLQKNHIPVLGERYLGNAMATKMSELVQKSEIYSKNKLRWMEIFKRYGIIVDGPEGTDETSPESSLSSEIEYD